MNSVYVLSRTDKNYDRVIEILSVHPTKQAAQSAERFYRDFVATKAMKKNGFCTDIREVPFES